MHDYLDSSFEGHHGQKHIDNLLLQAPVRTILATFKSPHSGREHIAETIIILFYAYIYANSLNACLRLVPKDPILKASYMRRLKGVVPLSESTNEEHLTYQSSSSSSSSIILVSNF